MFWRARAQLFINEVYRKDFSPRRHHLARHYTNRCHLPIRTGTRSGARRTIDQMGQHGGSSVRHCPSTV